MTRNATIDARATGILTRAVQPSNHDLSATAARALLRIRLHPDDRQRLHELLAKNREDALTADDRGELDCYLQIGMLVDVLQAKARASLHAARRRPARSRG